MSIEEISKSGVVIVPLIVATVEAVKASFPAERPLPKHYIPGITVGLGLAVSALVNWSDWSSVVLQGLAFGLAAIGLYSGATNTMRK